MLKEYIQKDGSDAQEKQASHWINFWKTLPLEEIEKRLKRIGSREEFPEVTRIIKDLGPSSLKILDIGCGTGEWVSFLNKENHFTVGVDISHEIQKTNRNRFPDFPFLVSNALKLPFSDESFDFVFSWGVFEHFEEGLSACLKECCRILKKSGMLLFSVPFFSPRVALQKSVFSLEPQRGFFYQYRFLPEEIVRELEQNGFQTKSIRPICFEEGFNRFLSNSIGIRNVYVSYIMRKFAGLVFPKHWFSHMLLGKAIKETDQ